MVGVKIHSRRIDISCDFFRKALSLVSDGRPENPLLLFGNCYAVSFFIKVSRKISRLACRHGGQGTHGMTPLKSGVQTWHVAWQWHANGAPATCHGDPQHANGVSLRKSGIDNGRLRANCTSLFLSQMPCLVRSSRRVRAAMPCSRSTACPVGWRAGMQHANGMSCWHAACQ
jgi:hypothetical protein